MSSASEKSVFMKHVLAAIKVVKLQRQRPCIERICRSLRIQQGMKNVEELVVEAELEAAVSRRELFAIDKNGFRSYQATQPRAGAESGGRFGIDGGVTKLTRKVFQAIVEICKGGGTPTLSAISDHIRHRCAINGPNVNALLQRIRSACMSAVSEGYLVEENKAFNLTDSGKTLFESCKKRSTMEHPPLRLDDMLSKKKPAVCIPICSLCLGKDDVNQDGITEKMLCCIECGRCGHPSCLQFSAELTATVRQMKWQCIECKMCSICAEAGREENMLFCDMCDRGFHTDCCRPPVLRRPKGAWVCFVCNGSNRRRCSGDGSPRRAYRRRQRNSEADDNVSEHSSNGEDDGDDELFKPDVLPPGVSDEDAELFTEAQKRIEQHLVTTSDDQPARCPSSIEIGKYRVTTWYSSPYPPTFAKLETLCICEQCLTYMDGRSVLDRHMEKCLLTQPPGSEIYRHDRLSIYEVDGNVSPIYCQNLCLLAKLFLDHKTLYYDVEPFVFYVLTINDDDGCHIVGYFSKEKYSQHKYNLSCIMTLPQYQRQGFGRLLIDFSYLMSRVEGVPGSPEKPLSDLGQISYESYWKSVIIDQLDVLQGQQVTIQGLSDMTGITVADIVSTLHLLGFIEKTDDDRFQLVIDPAMLDKHKEKYVARGLGHIKLDQSLLRWMPHVSGSMSEMDEKPSDKEELKSDVGEPVGEGNDQLSPLKRLRRSPGAALRSPSASAPSTPRSKNGKRQRQVAINNSDCAESRGRSKKCKLEQESFDMSSFEIHPLKSSTPVRRCKNLAPKAADIDHSDGVSEDASNAQLSHYLGHKLSHSCRGQRRGGYRQRRNGIVKLSRQKDDSDVLCDSLNDAVRGDDAAEVPLPLPDNTTDWYSQSKRGRCGRSRALSLLDPTPISSPQRLTRATRFSADFVADEVINVVKMPTSSDVSTSRRVKKKRGWPKGRPRKKVVETEAKDVDGQDATTKTAPASATLVESSSDAAKVESSNPADIVSISAAPETSDQLMQLLSVDPTVVDNKVTDKLTAPNSNDNSEKNMTVCDHIGSDDSNGACSTTDCEMENQPNRQDHSAVSLADTTINYFATSHLLDAGRMSLSTTLPYYNDSLSEFPIDIRKSEITTLAT